MIMKDPSFGMLDKEKCFPGVLAAVEPVLDQRPEEIVEVPLLLPGWQISALEREAHQRGLTAGEMVRHLLGDFINNTNLVKGRRKA